MGSHLPNQGLNLSPLHSKVDSYHWTTREDPLLFSYVSLKEARKGELYPSLHSVSPSMTSLCCPPLTTPPAVLLRPWSASSEASWQSAFYSAPIFSKTLPTLPRITVLLLLLSPQRTGSPGVRHPDSSLATPHS